jgi:hypothetical protein
MLVVGCWLLDVGCWMLVVGCWLLDVGCWMLDVGCWMLVVGCWMLPGFKERVLVRAGEGEADDRMTRVLLLEERFAANGVNNARNRIIPA